MAHKHSVYDTDLHFIVDPITRKITTECKKMQLMQNDHNSERFTFEIPRYIEGHDMILCNVVQIHYININSSNNQERNSDIYVVDDLQLSPDSETVVVGSWLVSNNATTYSGTLNFVIRFACINEDTGEIDYQWFTDIYSTITVSKGIYNVDIITEGNAYDVLTQWKEEITNEACEKATAISDATIGMLKEVSESIEDFKKRTEATIFTTNFETGNLEYTSPNYTFDVNEETGNLEWDINDPSYDNNIVQIIEKVTEVESSVSNKANKSTVETVTVVASDWIGDNTPYTNSISVSGVTAVNFIEVLTPSSVTDEQYEAYSSANITKITQSDNSITLYAYGIKPTIDLPITVIVRGDL